MNSRRLLLSGCLVMADGNAPLDRRPHDILIEGDRIVSVMPSGSCPAQASANRIDASGLIATAGMINGHLHSWDYYQKGRVENLPMELLMAHLRPKRPVPLSARQVYLRSMMCALECLSTGSTTLIDDMSLGQALDRSHVDAALQAYEDAGVRAYLGFSMIDKPVVDSWPFVDECFSPDLLAALRAVPRPDGNALLALVRELAGTRHPSTSRVAPIVAPSAPQRCSNEFLVACRALADEYNLPVIIHVLETRLQAVTADIFYGSTMVEHLDTLGFLKPNTALVHAVWLTDRDREIMASAGATLQHNPWSNAVLGSGVADFQAARKAGINLSMGSDGCAMTFNSSMLQSLATGACVGRIRSAEYQDWPSAAQLWSAATEGGAQALGRATELGRIAPGYKADLCLYRLDALSLTPLNEPVRQLVHAESGAGLDTVIVDGVPVMQTRRFTRVDAPRLIAEFQEQHRQLESSLSGSEEDARPLIAAIDGVYRRALTHEIAADTTRGLIDEHPALSAGCC